MIDRDGELDVAGMARASSLVQVASGTWCIAPRTKGWVVETARDWVQEIVEGTVILNPLDGDGSDLLGGEELEFHTLHIGGDWLCDIHGA